VVAMMFPEQRSIRRDCRGHDAEGAGLNPDPPARLVWSGEVSSASRAKTWFLRQDPLDDLAGDVGEAVIPALVLVGQPLVVDAEQVEDRGMEVVDVDAVGRDAVAEGVRRAEGDARLDPTAGRPDGETPRMVIAAVVGGGQLALAVVRPAELP